MIILISIDLGENNWWKSFKMNLGSLPPKWGNAQKKECFFHGFLSLVRKFETKPAWWRKKESLILGGVTFSVQPIHHLRSWNFALISLLRHIPCSQIIFCPGTFSHQPGFLFLIDFWGKYTSCYSCFVHFHFFSIRSRNFMSGCRGILSYNSHVRSLELLST